MKKTIVVLFKWMKSGKWLRESGFGIGQRLFLLSTWLPVLRFPHKSGRGQPRHCDSTADVET